MCYNSKQFNALKRNGLKRGLYESKKGGNNPKGVQFQKETISGRNFTGGNRLWQKTGVI